jgi:hypothetical protein
MPTRKREEGPRMDLSLAECRPEFESGEADAEAAQPKRLGDAGGSQSLWLPDAGRTDS